MYTKWKNPIFISKCTLSFFLRNLCTITHVLKGYLLLFLWHRLILHNKAASYIPLLFPSQPPCVPFATYPEFQQQISHFFQNFIPCFSPVQWQNFLYVLPFHHSRIFVYFSVFAVFPFTLMPPLLITLTYFFLSFSFPPLRMLMLSEVH